MATSDPSNKTPARRRAGPHPRRSVWVRLCILLIVLAAIFLLPRLADLFTPLD